MKSPRESETKVDKKWNGRSYQKALHDEWACERLLKKKLKARKRREMFEGRQKRRALRAALDKQATTPV